MSTSIYGAGRPARFANPRAVRRRRRRWNGRVDGLQPARFISTRCERSAAIRSRVSAQRPAACLRAPCGNLFSARKPGWGCTYAARGRGASAPFAQIPRPAEIRPMCFSACVELRPGAGSQLIGDRRANRGAGASLCRAYFQLVAARNPRTATARRAATD